MQQALTALDQIEADRNEAAERPVALLISYYVNANRDRDKQPQPYPLSMFQQYRQQQGSDGPPFNPATAAAAVALLREGTLPPIVAAVMPQLQQSLNEYTKAPEVRALRSADGAVWILAPEWTEHGVCGGLVAVAGRVSGVVELHDLDRPLLRYQVKIPPADGAGWIRARKVLALSG